MNPPAPTTTTSSSITRDESSSTSASSQPIIFRTNTPGTLNETILSGANPYPNQNLLSTPPAFPHYVPYLPNLSYPTALGMMTSSNIPALRPSTPPPNVQTTLQGPFFNSQFPNSALNSIPNANINGNYLGELQQTPFLLNSGRNSPGQSAGYSNITSSANAADIGLLHNMLQQHYYLSLQSYASQTQALLQYRAMTNPQSQQTPDYNNSSCSTLLTLNGNGGAQIDSNRLPLPIAAVATTNQVNPRATANSLLVNSLATNLGSANNITSNNIPATNHSHNSYIATTHLTRDHQSTGNLAHELGVNNHFANSAVNFTPVGNQVGSTPLSRTHRNIAPRPVQEPKTITKKPRAPRRRGKRKVDTPPSMPQTPGQMLVDTLPRETAQRSPIDMSTNTPQHFEMHMSTETQGGNSVKSSQYPIHDEPISNRCDTASPSTLGTALATPTMPATQSKIPKHDCKTEISQLTAVKNELYLNNNIMSPTIPLVPEKEAHAISATPPAILTPTTSVADLLLDNLAITHLEDEDAHFLRLKLGLEAKIRKSPSTNANVSVASTPTSPSICTLKESMLFQSNYESENYGLNQDAPTVLSGFGMESKRPHTIADGKDDFKQHSTHLHEIQENESSSCYPASDTTNESVSVASINSPQTVTNHDRFRGPNTFGCAQSSLIVDTDNITSKSSSLPIKDTEEIGSSASACNHLDMEGHSHEEMDVFRINDDASVNSSLTSISPPLCRGTYEPNIKRIKIVRHLGDSLTDSSFETPCDNCTPNHHANQDKNLEPSGPMELAVSLEKQQDYKYGDIHQSSPSLVDHRTALVTPYGDQCQSLDTPSYLHSTHECNNTCHNETRSNCQRQQSSEPGRSLLCKTESDDDHTNTCGGLFVSHTSTGHSPEKQNISLVNFQQQLPECKQQTDSNEKDPTKGIDLCCPVDAQCDNLIHLHSTPSQTIKQSNECQTETKGDLIKNPSDDRLISKQIRQQIREGNKAQNSNANKQKDREDTQINDLFNPFPMSKVSQRTENRDEPVIGTTNRVLMVDNKHDKSEVLNESNKGAKNKSSTKERPADVGKESVQLFRDDRANKLQEVVETLKKESQSDRKVNPKNVINQTLHLLRDRKPDHQHKLRDYSEQLDTRSTKPKAGKNLDRKGNDNQPIQECEKNKKVSPEKTKDVSNRLLRLLGEKRPQSHQHKKPDISEVTNQSQRHSEACEANKESNHAENVIKTGDTQIMQQENGSQNEISQESPGAAARNSGLSYFNPRTYLQKQSDIDPNIRLDVSKISQSSLHKDTSSPRHKNLKQSFNQNFSLQMNPSMSTQNPSSISHRPSNDHNKKPLRNSFSKKTKLLNKDSSRLKHTKPSTNGKNQKNKDTVVPTETTNNKSPPLFKLDSKTSPSVVKTSTSPKNIHNKNKRRSPPRTIESGSGTSPPNDLIQSIMSSMSNTLSSIRHAQKVNRHVAKDESHVTKSNKKIQLSTPVCSRQLLDTYIRTPSNKKTVRKAKSNFPKDLTSDFLTTKLESGHPVAEQLPNNGAQNQTGQPVSSTQTSIINEAQSDEEGNSISSVPDLVIDEDYVDEIEKKKHENNNCSLTHPQTLGTPNVGDVKSPGDDQCSLNAKCETPSGQSYPHEMVDRHMENCKHIDKNTGDHQLIDKNTEFEHSCHNVIDKNAVLDPGSHFIDKSAPLECEKITELRSHNSYIMDDSSAVVCKDGIHASIAATNCSKYNDPQTRQHNSDHATHNKAITKQENNVFPDSANVRNEDNLEAPFSPSSKHSLGLETLAISRVDKESSGHYTHSASGGDTPRLDHDGTRTSTTEVGIGKTNEHDTPDISNALDKSNTNNTFKDAENTVRDSAELNAVSNKLTIASTPRGEETFETPKRYQSAIGPNIWYEDISGESKSSKHPPEYIHHTIAKFLGTTDSPNKNIHTWVEDVAKGDNMPRMELPEPHLAIPKATEKSDLSNMKPNLRKTSVSNESSYAGTKGEKLKDIVDEIMRSKDIPKKSFSLLDHSDTFPLRTNNVNTEFLTQEKSANERMPTVSDVTLNRTPASSPNFGNHDHARSNHGNKEIPSERHSTFSPLDHTETEKYQTSTGTLLYGPAEVKNPSVQMKDSKLRPVLDKDRMNIPTKASNIIKELDQSEQQADRQLSEAELESRLRAVDLADLTAVKKATNSLILDTIKLARSGCKRNEQTTNEYNGHTGLRKENCSIILPHTGNKPNIDASQNADKYEQCGRGVYRKQAKPFTNNESDQHGDVETAIVQDLASRHVYGNVQNFSTSNPDVSKFNSNNMRQDVHEFHKRDESVDRKDKYGELSVTVSSVESPNVEKENRKNRKHSSKRHKNSEKFYQKGSNVDSNSSLLSSNFSPNGGNIKQQSAESKLTYNSTTNSESGQFKEIGKEESRKQHSMLDIDVVNFIQFEWSQLQRTEIQSLVSNPGQQEASCNNTNMNLTDQKNHNSPANESMPEESSHSHDSNHYKHTEMPSQDTKYHSTVNAQRPSAESQLQNSYRESTRNNSVHSTHLLLSNTDKDDQPINVNDAQVSNCYYSGPVQNEQNGKTSLSPHAQIGFTKSPNIKEEYSDQEHKMELKKEINDDFEDNFRKEVLGTAEKTAHDEETNEGDADLDIRLEHWERNTQNEDERDFVSMQYSEYVSQLVKENNHDTSIDLVMESDKKSKTNQSRPPDLEEAFTLLYDKQIPKTTEQTELTKEEGFENKENQQQNPQSTQSGITDYFSQAHQQPLKDLEAVYGNETFEEHNARRLLPNKHSFQHNQLGLTPKSSHTSQGENRPMRRLKPTKSDGTTSPSSHCQNPPSENRSIRRCLTRKATSLKLKSENSAQHTNNKTDRARGPLVREKVPLSRGKQMVLKSQKANKTVSQYKRISIDSRRGSIHNKAVIGAKTNYSRKLKRRRLELTKVNIQNLTDDFGDVELEAIWPLLLKGVPESVCSTYAVIKVENIEQNLKPFFKQITYGTMSEQRHSLTKGVLQGPLERLPKDFVTISYTQQLQKATTVGAKKDKTTKCEVCKEKFTGSVNRHITGERHIEQVELMEDRYDIVDDMIASVNRAGNLSGLLLEMQRGDNNNYNIKNEGVKSKDMPNNCNSCSQHPENAVEATGTQTEMSMIESGCNLRLRNALQDILENDHVSDDNGTNCSNNSDGMRACEPTQNPPHMLSHSIVASEDNSANPQPSPCSLAETPCHDRKNELESTSRVRKRKLDDNTDGMSAKKLKTCEESQKSNDYSDISPDIKPLLDLAFPEKNFCTPEERKALRKRLRKELLRNGLTFWSTPQNELKRESVSETRTENISNSNRVEKNDTPGDIENIDNPSCIENNDTPPDIENTNKPNCVENNDNLCDIKSINSKRCVENIENSLDMETTNNPNCVEATNNPRLENIDKPSCAENIDIPHEIENIKNPSLPENIDNLQCLKDIENSNQVVIMDNPQICDNLQEENIDNPQPVENIANGHNVENIDTSHDVENTDNPQHVDNLQFKNFENQHPVENIDDSYSTNEGCTENTLLIPDKPEEKVTDLVGFEDRHTSKSSVTKTHDGRHPQSWHAEHIRLAKLRHDINPGQLDRPSSPDINRIHANEKLPELSPYKLSEGESDYHYRFAPSPPIIHHPSQAQSQQDEHHTFTFQTTQGNIIDVFEWSPSSLA